MSKLKEYGLSERFTNEAMLYPELKPARVIAQYKGMYKVATDNGEFYAEVSGKFRYNVTTISLYPVTGDFVMVSGDESNAQAHLIIHNTLTRKSCFERKAVGVSGQAQVVASNIDVIFICMSLNNNYNLNRLERYLSIAWDSGATPVIVLTKADLCNDITKIVSEVEAASSFAEIIVTSALKDIDCDKIFTILKPGMTGSFIGSSGVGKSTLINRLMGNNEIETREIGKGDKGRHTTTGREMLILPNGAVVIDTPGMREIGVENADTSKSFADISELATKCRFSDCTHTNEPGCAVIEAVNDGRIDERRLENYRKICREAKYDGLSAKQIETEKLNTMLKDIGGMKKIRKYNRENNKRG